MVPENEKPGAKPGPFDADIRHPHRKPSSRSAQEEEVVATYIDLPLEAQAAIERTREKLLRHARVTFSILFTLEQIPISAHGVPSIPEQRKPATLKLALREYSCNLFDGEAQQYIKYAPDEETLRQSLEVVARCIASEVLEQMSVPAHDFHCTLEERRTAIQDGLRERIKHWIEVANKDVDATIARGRAILERAAPMLSGVIWGHTLEPEHTVFTQLETAPQQKSQHVEIPAIANLEPSPASPTAKEIIDAYCDNVPCSLDDLADKAGVDRRQVFRIRNGKPVRNFARIAVAKILGVSHATLKP